jgi:putative DNA primase/helicase
MEASDIAPFLAILSPEKRCGKTVLLDVVSRLVRRPLSASNITPAAIFRSVEKYGPTLLIDEADSFLQGNEELRGILNSGHRRSSAFVIRTVGEDHDPQQFSTWCPKVIARIGDLPDTLTDRSIVLRMQRKSSDSQVPRLPRDQNDAEFVPLRRMIVRWVADNLNALKNTQPSLPKELDDRAQDNWEPLLAIAEVAGGTAPEIARQAALTLSGISTREDESASTQLLADLREMFDAQQLASLSSKDIIEELGKKEDRPWPEWKNGKPITTRQLAKLLKRFGIKPKEQWNANQNHRGYDLQDFQDAFSRYLPPVDPLEPLETNKINDLSPAVDPLEKASPSRSENPATPSEKSILADLAHPDGQSREDTAQVSLADPFEAYGNDGMPDFEFP